MSRGARETGVVEGNEREKHALRSLLLIELIGERQLRESDVSILLSKVEDENRAGESLLGIEGCEEGGRLIT